MDFLKLFVPTYIIGMLVDFVWLGVIAGSLYKNQLGGLLRSTTAFAPGHWLSAALVYVAIVGGSVLFVLPKASSYGTAALYGALFGLVTYAIYELTNYALLVGWPLTIVFVDIAWGGVLGALTGLVLYACKSYFISS